MKQKVTPSAYNLVIYRMKQNYPTLRNYWAVQKVLLLVSLNKAFRGGCALSHSEFTLQIKEIPHLWAMWF